MPFGIDSRKAQGEDTLRFPIGSAHVALVVFYVPRLLPVMTHLIDIPEVPQHLRLAIGQGCHDALQVVGQLIDVSLHQHQKLLKTLLSQVAPGAVLLHAGGSGHRECIVNHIFGLSFERFPDAGR